MHIYRHDITEILLKVAWSTYALAKNNNAVGRQRNLGYRGISNYQTHACPKLILHAYLLTLPLFTGVSRVRALSPAWTGSHARETLISRTTSPNIKIKYNKILTYILRSIFLEIPHLELPRWWKTPRDTNGKWYPVIDLFDTLQVNWVMEIN